MEEFSMISLFNGNIFCVSVVINYIFVLMMVFDGMCCKNGRCC